MRMMEMSELEGVLPSMLSKLTFTDEETEAHRGQVTCLGSFRETGGRAKDF